MIPDALHHKLVAWAIWAKGSYFPKDFWVACESAEHNALADAGAVMDSTPERLAEALRRGAAPLSDHEAIQIELGLLKLPEKARKALRLHYLGYPRMSVNQKRRVLGVSIDGYHELVDNSAGALASILKIQLTSS